LRGNLLQETAPDASVTDYDYDLMDRVTSVLMAEVDSERPETVTAYNKAGDVVSTLDPELRETVKSYDAFGRLLSVTDDLSHSTTMGYDANSNLTSVTDELDQTTSHLFDTRDRRISTTDPRSGVTQFSFDAASNMVALTDSVGNTTRWSFDHLNRPIAETNELGETRSTFYDEVGNVVKIVDRNERVREFDFDPLHRQTEDRWKDGANTIRTISSLYNDADELIEIEDEDTGGTLSKLAFTHDALGRVTVVDNDGTADVPNVVLTSGYNTLSRRTSLAAEIDSTDDFLNTWTYDDLGRVTRVDQAGQMGGNTVAEKRVDFDYNLAGQFTQIVRYKDIDGGSGNEVATSAFTYDANIGLLTDLVHTHDTTTIADYAWSYEEINRVETFDWDDDFVDYGYNANSELTSANYTTQADESYSFDLNGNRTGGSYDTGDNNQLLSDGTYDYTFDDEGNRISREHISSGEVTDYVSDFRNRLVEVITWTDDSRTTATQIVAMRYDAFDRRIAKLVDTDGDEDFDTAQHYAYDGDQIALVFDGAGSLTNRILSGPAVDQVLADENLLEQVTAAARVRWPTTWAPAVTSWTTTATS
ncbi:MAG: RHS repeat protein, partial [Planctomycetes bacterium]|nr:RHS repeat protein [Planctomycetota bacterium]